jgi:hypothetical protein
MGLFLKKPEVAHYNTADHIAFHGSAYGISAKYSTVINAPALIADYKLAVDQETGVFNWIRKNEYTEKKAAADHRRDNVFTGMAGVVRINMRHFDPTRRDAAVHVYGVIENHDDVEHRDYGAETMILDHIILTLRGTDYADAVKLLDLTPWIDQLETENNAFKTYADDAVDLQLEKPGINSKAARRASDLALRSITDRVTALVNLNGPAQYADFAAVYNELVTQYNTVVNEHYGRLHAKIDIAPAIIAPIAVQPYTGKPVIVIPEVHIRRHLRDGVEETVELVFSQDFTVSYRDNTSPGTAMILIKGIGKYKGEAVATFNIN